MPEYLFVDGPLAGQSLNSGDPLVAGEVMAVEVVDVGQDVDDLPVFDYVLDSPPDDDEPGLLRHATLGPRSVDDLDQPSTAA